MRDLPTAIIHILRHFELAFSERVWEWTKVLLVGAILAPGTRTVKAPVKSTATATPEATGEATPEQ